MAQTDVTSDVFNKEKHTLALGSSTYLHANYCLDKRVTSKFLIGSRLARRSRALKYLGPNFRKLSFDHHDFASPFACLHHGIAPSPPFHPFPRHFHEYKGLVQPVHSRYQSATDPSPANI